ncbi:MAG: endonuclease NucS [Polyangiaceae bacterium]
MERYFNTSGACHPHLHFMLPPERRLDPVLQLIEQHRYFVFHSGRQTGKTTSLFWLEKHLTALGKRVLVLDVETAKDEPDATIGFRAIFERIRIALEEGAPVDGLRAATEEQVTNWLQKPQSAILNYFRFLTTQDPRPFVLLIDEADSLLGDTVVKLLGQIRDGYLFREKVPFPASIVLVGMRAIRDYAITKEQGRAVSWLGSSSPFNVTAESTMLEPFTEAETSELLGQHTSETGQRFEPEAIAKVWELAEGHPWITNALADQATRKDVRDRTIPITAAHIEAAKETIILERRTHIDSVISRLREPRVARILGPMLLGDAIPPSDQLHDDLSYVIGMGLLRVKNRRYEIPNAVYREIIPRALTFDTQMQMSEQTAWYVAPDGSLDMDKLFRAWQSFWASDGHLAADGFAYREAGAHLTLMAFLQRIVNGGGRISREYGLGRGALDLLIDWKDRRHVIELKLRRDSRSEPRALEQLTRYLDGLGLSEGWLVLFDLRKDLSWEEKLTMRDVIHEGKTVHIVGC